MTMPKLGTLVHSMSLTLREDREPQPTQGPPRNARYVPILYLIGPRLSPARFWCEHDGVSSNHSWRAIQPDLQLTDQNLFGLCGLEC